MQVSLSSQGSLWSVGAGVLIAFLSLTAAAVVNWRQNAGAQLAASWVAHTHRVTQEIGQTYSLVQDIQMAQRGYVITGETRYLEPYDGARARLADHLERLKALLLHDSAQLDRFHQLRTEVQRRVDFAAEVVATYDRSGPAAAANLIRTGRGKEMVDRIRTLTDQMEADQARLLAVRVRAEQDAAAKSRTAVVSCYALSLILLMAASRGVWRAYGRRVTAEREATRAASTLRELARELELRHGEIRDLYDHAPCGYHSLDREGRFVHINETELRWLGYEREELQNGCTTFATLLNSVNVAVGVAVSGAQRANDGALGRLVGMLESRRHDLPAYLAEGDRASKVIQYLGAIRDRAEEKRVELLQELSAIRNGVDHINAIVATQQAYATTSALIAPVPLAELVADAVRLTQASFERHGVALECGAASSIEVSTDRHKVVEIVVNLLRNAAQACGRSRAPEKRVALLTQSVGGMATVAVVDNGVGIPVENLARIFHHGFTTHAEGHGFGLHSCALNARQLGGALAAESAGPDRGARFTLQLPLSSPVVPAATGGAPASL